MATGSPLGGDRRGAVRREFRWPIPLSDVHKYLDQWDEEAAGLVIWAMLAADGLVYLTNADADMRAGVLHPSPSWQAVDISHARWAATSAVAVLDLAAGALGRLHLVPKPKGREYALADFFDRDQGKERRRALTGPARHWIETTWGNATYRTVRRARDPFTHGKMRMSVTVTLDSPLLGSSRTTFHVGPKGEPVDSQSLIGMAFRVVQVRFGAFLAELEADGFLPASRAKS